MPLYCEGAAQLANGLALLSSAVTSGRGDDVKGDVPESHDQLQNNSLSYWHDVSRAESDWATEISALFVICVRIIYDS